MDLKKISEAFAMFITTIGEMYYSPYYVMKQTLGSKGCGKFGNMPVAFCETTISLFETKTTIIKWLVSISPC